MSASPALGKPRRMVEDSPALRRLTAELDTYRLHDPSGCRPVAGSAPVTWARCPRSARCTPELSWWVVDELVAALVLGHGVTDLDGLHWVFG